MTANSSRRSLLHNAMVALQGEGGAALLNAIAMALVARSLGVEGFGRFAYLLGAAELAGRICYPQCWDGLIRFGARARIAGTSDLVRQAEFCFRLDALGCLVACAVLLGLAPVLIAVAGMDDSSLPAAFWMALYPLGWSADTAIGVFRLYDRFKLYSRIQILLAITRCTLCGALLLADADITAFSIAFVITGLIGVAVKYGFASQLVGYRLRPGLRQDLEWARSSGLLQFLWFQHLNVSTRAFATKLDVIVLGAVATPAVVGAYRVATYFGGLITTVTAPLYTALYPELSRLIAEGARREELRQAVLLTFKVGSAVVFSAFVTFLVFGQPLIEFAFGAQFLPAFELGIAYFSVIAATLVTSPLYTLLVSNGQARDAFTAQCLATAVIGLCLVPACSLWGGHGAVGSVLLYYVVWGVWARLRLKLT